MNVHIISQPHTQLTNEYIRCAYTSKCVKLCKMLVKEGVNVTVYAGEDNETPAKLETCITKKQLAKLGFNGPDDYLKNDFDFAKPLWKVFHQGCIYNLNKNLKKGDIIGTFSGRADEQIAKRFPNNRMVELGIGYSGVFSGFKVFESAAWMHTAYGAMAGGNAAKANGNHYDCVIPNFFDPKEFPYSKKKGGYYLFVGRMIQRKGVQIFDEIAKRMPDSKFIMAGQGAKQIHNTIVCDDGTRLTSRNIEYIGTIDAKKRGKLMSEAKALICPTIYVGPFEGVHVEAMMCGTPVITTTFGGFTETFLDGVHGFRCHNIKQFTEAACKVKELDRTNIRKYAQSRYSMDVVAKQYIKYFELIEGLDRGGFYEI